MVDTELLMGVYVCVRGYDEEYAGRKYWNCTGTGGLQNKTYKINPTLVVICNPEVNERLITFNIVFLQIE